jgi:hypothetical protein
MVVGKKPLVVFDTDEMEEECDWELACEMIGRLLSRFKSGHVYIQGRDMGWNHRSGYCTHEIGNLHTFSDQIREGRDLLMKIAPQGQPFHAVFHTLDRGRGLYVTVQHHDNPVGGDRFEIRPIALSTYEKCKH